ncbi:hypothetical protein B0T18DRAFT_141740 [Schizothecium vesticola]|uniref:Uncharacterized protein n=1 Tax=Schizothecium vesticola TaxID=314040 RepID=A0AA40EUY0_9PEZI|nr:hypothetical protein B0T18DRAFT_141740 [Schizothecium vesticola]
MDRDQDVGATKKKGKKSKAKQRQTTEDEPIDAPLVETVAAAEPEAMVIEEPVAAEDDALAESGAKKAKKSKKKKQSSAVLDKPEPLTETPVVEEQLAAPDVSEPVISEASPEVANVVDAAAVEAPVPTSELETPLVVEAHEDESAVPASKKNKKKKKKQGSAVSDDSEPPLATTSEAQEQLLAEDASTPVLAEELEAASVEAPESSVQELPEVDEAAPVSKKAKKNKKKKQGSVVLDEPEPSVVDLGDAGDEVVVSDTFREVAVPGDLEVSHVEPAEAAAVEGSEPVSEPLAVEVSEPVSEPAAVEVPEDESAVPSSKKSKKDKKKKKQDVTEVPEPPVIEPAPEPLAVETPGAADQELATLVEVAVPEQSVEEEAVQEEVVEDDLVSQTVTCKMGKKDKKKKQAALDESSEPAPVKEPVQGTDLEPAAIVEKEISSPDLQPEASAPQEEQERAPESPPLADVPAQQDPAEPGSSTKKGKKNKKRKDSIQSSTPTSLAMEEPLPVEESEHIAPAPAPSSSERDIPTTEEEPLPSEAMSSDPVGLGLVLSDPVLSPSEAGTSTQSDPANEGTVEITEAVDTAPGSKKAKKKKKKPSKASESLLEEPVPDNEAVVSAEPSALAADEPTPAAEPISPAVQVKDESEPSSEAQLDTVLSKEPVEVTAEAPTDEPLDLQSETAPSEEPDTLAAPSESISAPRQIETSPALSALSKKGKAKKRRSVAFADPLEEYQEHPDNLLDDTPFSSLEESLTNSPSGEETDSSFRDVTFERQLQEALPEDPQPVEPVVEQKDESAVGAHPEIADLASSETIMPESEPVQETPVTVLEDEESAPSSKKAKKDKKKKRKGQTDSEPERELEPMARGADPDATTGDGSDSTGAQDPPPAASTTDSLTSGGVASEPEPMSAAEAPASIGEPEADFSSSPKKSKKEKKKKKAKKDDVEPEATVTPLLESDLLEKDAVEAHVLQPPSQEPTSPGSLPEAEPQQQEPPSSAPDPTVLDPEPTKAQDEQDVQGPAPGTTADKVHPRSLQIDTSVAGPDRDAANDDSDSGSQTMSPTSRDDGSSPTSNSIRKARKDKDKKKKKPSKSDSDGDPWPTKSPELSPLSDYDFEGREIERRLKQLSTVEEETEPSESVRSVSTTRAKDDDPSRPAAPEPSYAESFPDSWPATPTKQRSFSVEPISREGSPAPAPAEETKPESVALEAAEPAAVEAQQPEATRSLSPQPDESEVKEADASTQNTSAMEDAAAVLPEGQARDDLPSDEAAVLRTVENVPSQDLEPSSPPEPEQADVDVSTPKKSKKKKRGSIVQNSPAETSEPAELAETSVELPKDVESSSAEATPTEAAPAETTSLEQVAAETILAEPISQIDNAVSSLEPEVSDELAKNLDDAPASLDRSLPEPTPELAVVENDFAASGKKAKKDKKQKKGTVQSVSEPASEASVPLIEEFVAPIPAVTEEPDQPVAESQELVQEASPLPEPTVQVPDAEESSPAPTKKSKKKKKGGAQPVSETASGVSTPAVEEPPVLADAQATEESTVLSEEPAVPVPEILPAEGAEEFTKELEAGDYLAEPTKKSKKDKKDKKKGSALSDFEPPSELLTTVAEELPVLAETPEAEPEPSPTEIQEAVTVPEAFPSEDVETAEGLAAEDLSVVPTKKSKKDKKGKKKGIAQPDAEPEPEPASEAIPQSVEEPIPPPIEELTEQHIAPISAAHEEPSEPIVEPQETAQESPSPDVADDAIKEPEAEPAPSKKAKKDKKKKKASVQLDSETPSEPATPGVEEPSPIIPSDAQDPEPAITETTDPVPEASMADVVTEAPKEPEASEDALAAPSKKPKKEKKRKGSKASEPEPTSDAPAPVVDEPSVIAEEPTVMEKPVAKPELEPEVVVPESSQPPVSSSEEVQVQPEAQPEDPSDVPTKKSKKDKKRKGSKVTEPEQESALVAETPVVQDLPLFEEPATLSDPALALDEPMVPAEREVVEETLPAIPDTTKTEPEPEAQVLVAESPAVEEVTPAGALESLQPEPQPEEAFDLPAKKKKGKKDKKGKGKAEEPEITEPAPVPEGPVLAPDGIQTPSVLDPGPLPAVVEDPTPAVEDVASEALAPSPETPLDEPEEISAAPSKKSKKSKKGKSKTIDIEPTPDVVPEELPAPAEEASPFVPDETVPVADSEVILAGETVPVLDTLPVLDIPVQEEQAEDAFAVSSKKSKKSKKGKSKAVEEESAATTPVIEDSVTVAEEPTVVPEEPPIVVEEPESLAAEESTAAPEPIPEPAQDDQVEGPGMLGKKSKKSKNGKSKAANEEPATLVPVEEPTPSAEEPSAAVVDEPMLMPEPEQEEQPEDFSISTKKAKKDKKRKSKLVEAESVVEEALPSALETQEIAATDVPAEPQVLADMSTPATEPVTILEEAAQLGEDVAVTTKKGKKSKKSKGSKAAASEPTSGTATPVQERSIAFDTEEPRDFPAAAADDVASPEALAQPIEVQPVEVQPVDMQEPPTPMLEVTDAAPVDTSEPVIFAGPKSSRKDTKISKPTDSTLPVVSGSPIVEEPASILPESSPETAADISAAGVSQDQPQPEPQPEEASDMTVRTKKGKKDKKRKGSKSVEVEAEAEASSELATPVPELADATPKLDAPVVADTTEPVAAPLEEPAASPEEPLVQAEDEPAPTTKKSKKEKKRKGSKSVEAEADAEASSELATPVLEPNTPAVVETSEPALTLAEDPAVTPDAPVEEPPVQVKEEWASTATTKKPKKDKKKGKKLVDPEPTVEPASTSTDGPAAEPLAEIAVEAASEPASEPVIEPIIEVAAVEPTVVVPTVADTPREEPSTTSAENDVTDPAIETAAEERGVADEASAAPAKKSKKKKGKKLAELEPASEPAAEVTAEPAAERELVLEPSVFDTPQEEISTHPVQDEVVDRGIELAPEVDESLAAVPAKKAEKDKKKGEKLAELEPASGPAIEAGPEPATEPISEPVVEAAEAIPEPVVEIAEIATESVFESAIEPTDIDPPAEASTFLDPSPESAEQTVEPVLDAVPDQPAEDDMWPAPTKKEKKSKKKGKKQVELEPVSEPSAFEPAVEPSSEPTVETVGESVAEPTIDTPVDEPIIVVAEPTLDSVLDAASEQQAEDDTWAAPTKKDKKSKKKGKKQQLEPESELTHASPSGLIPIPVIELGPESVIVDVPVEETYPLVAVEQSVDPVPEISRELPDAEAADDTWAMPTKKDKKGKGKGKKQQLGLESELVSEPATEPAPEPASLALAEPTSEPAAMDILAAAPVASPVNAERTADPLPEAVPQSPAVVAADEWTLPASKPKKSKKGKKKQLELEPEPDLIFEALCEPIVIDDSVQETSPDPGTAEQLVDPAAEAIISIPDAATDDPAAEAEEWVAPVKKGKKQLDFETTLESTPEATSEPAVEVTPELAVFDTPEEHITSSIPSGIAASPEPAPELIPEPVASDAPENPIARSLSTDVGEGPIEPISETSPEAALKNQVEDSWALPAKKPKKPKKGKKADTEITSEPTVVGIPQEEIIIPETPADDVPKPSAEPAIEAAPGPEAEDSSALPVKKEKKGKGKKQTSGFDSSTATPTVELALPDHVIADDLAPIEPEDLIPEPMSRGLPADDVQADQEPFVEDSWALPAKKPKKNKKGKKQAAEDESETAIPIVDKEAEAASFDIVAAEELTFAEPDTHAQESSSREISTVGLAEAFGEDSWALPAKKSKKKGKKAAEVDFDTPPAVESGVEAALPEVALVDDPLPVGREVSAPEFSTRDLSMGDVAEAKKEEPAVEDFWALPAKKPKKDKKKKKATEEDFSTFAPPIISEEYTATQDAPEPEPLTIVQPEPPVEAESSREIPFENTVAEEAPKGDEWPESSDKKSRKRKGKKVDVESASEVQTPMFEDEKHVVGAQMAIASNEANQNDFADFSSKSKKDKKKKRKDTALFFDDEPTTSEQPETPAGELVRSIRQKETWEGDDYFQPKTPSKEQEVPADVIHLHPAVTLPPIGLGLIHDPPVLYPLDAPTPQLLTALQSPISPADETTPPLMISAKLFENILPEQSAMVKHEPSFEYEGHGKKDKTRELDSADVEKPVISAREIAAPFLETSTHEPEPVVVESKERHISPKPSRHEAREIGDYIPDSPTPSHSAIEFDTPVVESTPAPQKSMAREVAADLFERSDKKEVKPKESDASMDMDDVFAGAAVAGALVGGAKLVAEKFGGGDAKKKGGKKNNKSVDHRSVREDDLFDDASLWEGR